MALTYSVEDNRALVVAEGDFTFDDIQAAFSDVRSECADSETFRILIVDHASAFDPSEDEVRELAKFWGRLFRGVPTRIALVVARELHYGIGRMIEVYARPTDFRFRVFREEDEGRAWLDAAPAQTSSDGSAPSTQPASAG